MRMIIVFSLIVVIFFALNAIYSRKVINSGSNRSNEINFRSNFSSPASADTSNSPSEISPAKVKRSKTAYLEALQSNAQEARFIAIAPYHAELIKQALFYSDTGFGEFTARTIDKDIPNVRIMQQVLEGHDINVFWGPALEQYSRSELFKINIPLVRGLLGCRIMLIRKGEQDKFSNLASPMDILYGLGNGWADTKIFEQNHLRFLTAIDNEALYYTLSAGRYDAVPFGADFVYKHLMASRNHVNNLELEEENILYYPMPVIFYVNRNFPALAYALENGLKNLQKNGKMLEIFNKHNRDVYSFLNLKNRKVFTLHNPMLAADAPVIESPCQL